MFGEKGLVQVYTGEGKGKTTSALGLALRAIGHGASVVVVQFMKGWDSYGELRSALKLENIKIIQTGRPDYVYKGKELPEDYEEAERGIETARQVMNSGKCDMLILDEINVALSYGLITLESVLELIKNKPVEMEYINAFAKAALIDVNPRTSWRATKEFRLHLVEELANRALIEAIKRSGGII